mmetsp:Transcript_31758/g.82877  ORF Transcript_31758/g.82877 Transcript_31758/m.82877 type:complete len:205 (-) Transcript_31758:362-976(-)
MCSALSSAKSTLRRQMRLVLRNAEEAGEIRKKSEDACKALVQLEVVQKAQSVAVFLSMPLEIQTDAAVRSLLKQGKTVYAPVVTSKDTMEFYTVGSEDELGCLHKNHWGIPEPKRCGEEMLAEGVDVVVTPGLAFDRCGRRLGQGKGYYDRYFERLRKRGLDPRLIGFCLDEQIVKEVPTGEDDACVGAIVTPSRVLACKQDVN